MNTYQAFGELIEHYLLKRERSASWLAERLQVSPSTVTRWRNGETRPNTPELVVRIMDVLGVGTAEREHWLRVVGYAYQAESVEKSPTGKDSPAEQASAVVTSEDAPTAVSNVDLEGTANAAEPLLTAALTAVASRPAAGRQEQTQIGHKRLVYGILAVALLGLFASSGWLVKTKFVGTKPTVRTFAIGGWTKLGATALPYEKALEEGTRAVLYAKLNRVTGLQGIQQEALAATGQPLRPVDIWIQGSYRTLDQLQLAATLSTQDGVISTTVNVVGEIDTTDAAATEVCLLALQNQLALAIVQALKLAVTTEQWRAIDQTPTQNCTALQRNNRAVELLEANNLPMAQSLLEEALQLDPAYADAYNNLGRVAYGQRDWSTAITLYQKALTLQPKQPLYYFNLGLAYNHNQQNDQAVAAYAQALQLDRTYSKVYNNWGFTLLEMQKPAEAQALLQRGLALEPENAYLHKNLGRAYLALQQPAQAVPELQKANALAPAGRFPEALYYLAVAQGQLNAKAAACATLQHYAEGIDPQEPTLGEAKRLSGELACQIE